MNAKIYSKSVCVKGRKFRSLNDCILFYQNNDQEGQFQWFLDIVSYLQFTTEKIIDVENSQSSEIHEYRVCRMAEQSSAIALFCNYVPSVFAGLKKPRDS